MKPLSLTVVLGRGGYRSVINTGSRWRCLVNGHQGTAISMITGSGGRLWVPLWYGMLPVVLTRSELTQDAAATQQQRPTEPHTTRIVYTRSTTRTVCLVFLAQPRGTPGTQSDTGTYTYTGSSILVCTRFIDQKGKRSTTTTHWVRAFCLNVKPPTYGAGRNTSHSR